MTVVVGCVEAERSIERCLSALEAACSEVTHQLIVVDASRDSTAAIVQRLFPTVWLIRYPVGTLVPQLWAAGFGAATGRAVAFTIGHAIVSPTWSRALLDGLADSTGVGGPLVLADDAPPVAWAVFYLRYSAFLHTQLGDGLVPGEIAGDNAAYDRAALDRHASSLHDGFWEVEFHRLVRAEGGRLRGSQRASASFADSSPFWCIVRHRFAHGRHFGARRVAHGAHPLRIVLLAPVVPFALVWRAARRVLPVPSHRGRFVVSLPIFMALAASWAAGEAIGAANGT